MYEVGKRIKATRESKGISQKDFAVSIGAKNTTVANWEKGLTRPDVDTLALICEVLNVSPDILLDISVKSENGVSDHPLLKKYNTLDHHGKKAVDSILNIEYDRIQAETKEEPTEETNIIKLPIQEYEEKVCAGTGHYLDYTTAFITELDYEPPHGADFIVTVSGDSMEPTISDGDRLFISKTKELDYGDIGIFYIPGDGLAVKEYTPEGLKAHNEKFPFVPGNGEIDTIGKVIGKVK